MNSIDEINKCLDGLNNEIIACNKEAQKKAKICEIMIMILLASTAAEITCVTMLLGVLMWNMKL